MSEIDRDYYLARLFAEREAAGSATSDVARAAHAALAMEYAKLLEVYGHRVANDPGTPDSVPQLSN
jgi:hypothetical protein